MKQQKKKILDMVRDKVRLKHYSLSTGRTYFTLPLKYFVSHKLQIFHYLLSL